MKKIKCTYKLVAIEILKKEKIDFDEIKGFYPKRDSMRSLLNGETEKER